MFRISILLAILIHVSCSHIRGDQKQNRNSCHPREEIQLIFNTSDDMFPESWFSGEIKGKAIPLDSTEYERSERIIRKALGKYPDGFAEQYLRKIYVLGYLEFFGVEYGGTNTEGVIYISNRGTDMGYTDSYLEQTFHHEFSSLLYFAHPEYFKKEQWKKLNRGFTYGGGGVAAIQTGTASTELSDFYAEMGVLSQYATADIEEDFNLFAEQIFCASDRFWTLVDTYPALNKKVKIMADFYGKIHPVFTIEYFRKISKD